MAMMKLMRRLSARQGWSPVHRIRRATHCPNGTPISTAATTIHGRIFRLGEPLPHSRWRGISISSHIDSPIAWL